MSFVYVALLGRSWVSFFVSIMSGEKGRVYLDAKGAHRTAGRAGRQKKRRFHGNQFTKEDCSEPKNPTREKLRRSVDLTVPQDNTSAYRLINFVCVFSALETCLVCKECESAVQFSETSVRGFGFKLKVKCVGCSAKEINSCKLVDNHAYEVNRRTAFAFRMLGIGLAGIQMFAGLMDLPTYVRKSMFDRVVKQIKDAAIRVGEASMRRAVEAEKALTAAKEGLEEAVNLTVSGDGTWRKRGHNSKQGVITLIGNFSGQVVSLVVKNLFCMACKYMEQFIGTDEYLVWLDNHEEDCTQNHDGSSGKMEQDGLLEMFKNSWAKYGARFLRYVGDGDSSAFAALRDNQPYGGDFPVEKRECVNHIQKRMGTRLRAVKKKTPGLNRKLTCQLIEELTIFYGNAIREFSDNLENMKRAAWATFYHKISTDNKPQHHLCPDGENSWCKYNVAKAEGKLDEFTHKPALPPEVQKAIKPVYEDLCRDELLQRCLGGYHQNSNESLNQKIWKIAPKHMYSGVETVDIAAHMAAASFNNGAIAYLQCLVELGCSVGEAAHKYCKEENARRQANADAATARNTKELRREARKKRMELERQQREEEGALYGAGMAE